MSPSENCSLDTKCPINSDDANRCCVALISPRELITDGICQGLEPHNEIYLQDRFDDCDALLNSRRPPCYEVVLINARLIQYPLSDFFRQIQNKAKRARLVVFAAESDNQYLKALMRAGVYGFVPPDASIDELCEAIMSVKSGQLWFNRSLLDEVVFDAMEFERMIEQSIKDRINLLKDQMTARESDVFCLVLEGLSTKQIANQIHMSEPTVKQHLTSLFKKFDVTNRSQLILMGFQRVCPVSNMIKLFRRTLDRRRIENGDKPLILDPLED